MSEIRDRIGLVLAEVFEDGMLQMGKRGIYKYDDKINKILSIPELAIVDREAELPPNLDNAPIYPYSEGIDRIQAICAVSNSYIQAQQDMVKAGYVKEIKE